MLKQDIAKMIDHTNLKPVTTAEEVEKNCREAVDYGFASVCVNPVYVPTVNKMLQGSEVLTCCVVGFPLGADPMEVKAAETEWAVDQGAEEIDMVIHIGSLKAGDTAQVTKDISAVVDAAAGNTVKVIIETCYLTDEEKKSACECARQAGAHFVKTSTGFGSGGATTEDVALMREAVGDTMKIKASGGIRSYEDAIAMIEAGADRIGASAGIKIVEAAEE